MRRRVRLRRSTLRRAVLAAPILAAPVLGAGLAEAAGTQTGAAGSGSGQAISMDVKQRRIAYGHDVAVTGRAPSKERGRWVDLDFAPAGGSSWHKIASAKIDAQNRFHLHASLRHSGRVKVVGAWQSSPASSATTTSGGGTLTSTTVANPTSAHPAGDRASAAASRPQSVEVMAALHVHPRTIDDMGGHGITVSGHLQPVRRGLHVRLLAKSGGSWHTVARDLTGASGRFYLHYRPHSRQERLRVHFVGDRSNAPVHTSAGHVVVFTQSVASWYYDSGSTACGFHATYGVANVSLPCGTKVTFVYHGRSVTATVDDRGPYVGGREWDLSQTTAGRLGFNGVDDVWASR